ncbi:MAG: tyrosine protein phosphatase [Candidatus Aminicenantes bacterium]|nr:MAG: tyrosine protein phosphatase [Candidatus Aminicenantes bacterium]
MIDLHSHIIPGVDDGSRSMEESLRMLEMAWQDGVKAIAATPHILGQASKIKYIRHLPGLFAELRKKAAERHIEIEILPGAEVFFTSDLKEKLEGFRELITLNRNNYFLLEFPPDTVFPGTKAYIFNLESEGFIPIICHPERNLVFQQNLDLLYDLLQAGALVQVDVGSLRGDFGHDAHAAAMALLKYNLVHVIASDCHDIWVRIPGLSIVYNKLRGMEKEKIDMLVEKIPLAIVTNNPLPDIGPLMDPRRKSWFPGLFKRRTACAVQ